MIGTPGVGLLDDLRESLPEEAHLVSDRTSDGWETATVWSPVLLDFPAGIAVKRRYPAEGTAPAVEHYQYDVRGWFKYELAAASPDLYDSMVRGRGSK